MKTSFLVFAFLFAASLGLKAQQSDKGKQMNLDSVQTLLEHAPVQEKVYLHLDNNCYFKGDTIWYKVYVVSAKDLTYTDQSKLVYVELVSPDGLVVERQTLVVSEQGYGAGDFQLTDSLYSGFYELRAYTKWMLNFCVTHHSYDRKDREQFYNRAMADDFFRLYGTVYSRVVPVYERPEKEGEYAKFFVSRAKTRYDKEEKERLKVTFFPEGGHLLAGTRCRVAFEAKDEEGQSVDLEGTVSGKTIKTQHEGRGVFEIDVPEDDLPKARFQYKDKSYSFDLPKVEKTGCALMLQQTEDEVVAHVNIKGMKSNQYAIVVMCRGILQAFEEFSIDDKGQATVAIDKEELSTGVNDMVVIDREGAPMADRLFFVNNGEYDHPKITIETDKIDYEPFEPITLRMQTDEDIDHLSIAVRDRASEELSYDTGNILTELLLSSELKGFIPHPDQYFMPGDDHSADLDLLLRVQGWRRYDYKDITSGQELRYTPEQNLSVEGGVYNTVSFDAIRNCEMKYWAMGVFGVCDGDEDNMDPNDPKYQKDVMGQNAEDTSSDLAGMQMETIGQEETQSEKVSADDPHFGVNHGGLRHEVTVEGELVLGMDIATVSQETHDGGRFSFNVPPFYGKGILFLYAHKTGLSEDKMKKRIEHWADEDAWPDYYVKRDLFFPVFAKQFDYYQCHQPEYSNEETSWEGGTPLDKGERLSSMDTNLDNLEVKGKRRKGRRAIDYNQPAFVGNAFEIYNLVTDYGLSFGKLNFRRFPQQVCMLLLGNYNSERRLLIDGIMDDYLFFRNYQPDDPFGVLTMQMKSDYAIAKDLVLARQRNIRLFTDFELRNEHRDLQRSSMVADVTLDFVTFPDDAMQTTYRDRRIIIDGVYLPDDFYHPDYSQQPPAEGMKDYRRTLYWNPNAMIDEDGCFNTTFYNNGKTTRIQIDAAGISNRGIPISIKK